MFQDIDMLAQITELDLIAKVSNPHSCKIDVFTLTNTKPKSKTFERDDAHNKAFNILKLHINATLITTRA